MATSRSHRPTPGFEPTADQFDRTRFQQCTEAIAFPYGTGVGRSTEFWSHARFFVCMAASVNALMHAVLLRYVTTRAGYARPVAELIDLARTTTPSGSEHARGDLGECLEEGGDLGLGREGAGA